MKQVIELRSNFDTLKLTLIRLVLFLAAIFPWLISLFSADKWIGLLTIPTCVVVFALTLFVKICRKVVIDPQEHFVSYFWINLWGKKSEITIDTNNAYIDLKIIKYKVNDLWELAINDTQNLSKKIGLTEIISGFDGKQLQYIYKVLMQKNNVNA